MNQRILITGAASGIGKRLTERLLASGASVCGVDIDTAGLAALKGENLLTEKLDVRDPVQWAALFERLEAEWGGPEVVINSAGVCRPGYVQDSTPEQVDFHFDINVKGVMHGTRFAVQHMLKHGGGHIINIASLAGIAPVSGLTLYSASKFAVRGFTLAAAQDLADTDVKISCVCPDAVATPMVDLQVDYEQAALTFSGGRILTVDQVCDVIINKVMKKQPLEVTIKAGRGFLAKISNMFPGFSALLTAMLRKKGLKKQAAIKSAR